MDPSTSTSTSASTPTPTRRWRWAALAVALLALVTLAAAFTFGADDAAPPPATTTTSTTIATTTTAPTTTTTIPLDPTPPTSTATATLRGSVPRYDAPGGAPTGTVDSLYYRNPTALPVVEEAPGGWLRVRTPYRPNGSTTWIRATDAVLGSTPWAIQIDVTKMRLRLYDAGELVVDAPVAVGTDVTPTALGDFFVTHLQPPPNPSYGPFVIITSGHSEVLQSFDGFPDAIFGIHGPIGSDSWIGDTGARISNGCVRMHVVDQEKLAPITPGTPVHVYASPAVAT